MEDFEKKEPEGTGNTILAGASLPPPLRLKVVGVGGAGGFSEAN